MKFKDYLTKLNDIINKHPEVLNYEVVYSVDDEGNSFHQVIMGPDIGEFENTNFTSETETPNAICLN